MQQITCRATDNLIICLWHFAMPLQMQGYFELQQVSSAKIQEHLMPSVVMGRTCLSSGVQTFVVTEIGMSKLRALIGSCCQT